MEHWITLTDDLALDGLNVSELAALKRADGDGNIVASLISDCVAEIRANIASANRNTLPPSPDTRLIPSCLKACACAILRYRLLTRLSLVISEGRTKEWEAANVTLGNVRRGELLIPSAGGVEQPPKAARPSYVGRPARWKMR